MPARVSPVLVLLACALALVLPTAAHADGFVQVFAVPGWTFVSTLGNTDDDPASELLMVNKSLGYFGIFDGITGALQQSFTAIKQGTGSIVPIDFDGDGKFELAIAENDGAGHSTFGIWHYVGGSFVPYFEHNVPIVTYSTAHLRSAATLDLIEFRSNDILVRDIPTGAVLWQASVNFPGWSPASPIAYTADLGSGGLAELLVTDHTTALRAFKYNAGSFQPLWSRAGTWDVVNLFNSDTDPQSEIGLISSSDVLPGACLVLDGLTGASELDLSAFTGFSDVAGIDVDGDGHPEIRVTQTLPDLTRLYKWNGAGYTTMCSHTDPATSAQMYPMRAANQLDFVEVQPNELKIRDNTGHVFFTASTALPGWGAGSITEIPFDFDHDGIDELLLVKGSNTWMLQYRGTMQPIWSLPGIVPYTLVGNTDGDPQDELVCVDPLDGHFRLYDSMTGTLAMQWPQYTWDNSLCAFGPWEQNGRNTLMFFRSPNTVDPGAGALATRLYRWDGSGYPVAMQFEDSVSSIRGDQYRDASHWELIEYAKNGDLIMRDAVVGNILFQASLSVSGWPGLDSNTPLPTSTFVFDPRGARETAVNDLSGMRMLRRAVSLGVPFAGPPHALRMLPSMPNPFRGATTLRFELPRAASGAVRIYDVAGRVLRKMDLALEAGLNTVDWDGMTSSGQPAPDGVLFYDLSVDGARGTMKLVRLR